MSVIAKTILAKNSANNGALYIGSMATIGALVLDSNPASSVASHATIQYAFNSGSDTGKWEVLYDPATYGSAHGFVSLPNMPVAGDQTQAIEFPLVQANSVQISGTAQTAGDIINQIGSVGSAVSTASGYASTAASQSTTAASTASTIDGLLTGADSLAAIHAAASSAASNANTAASYANSAASYASTAASQSTTAASTASTIDGLLTGAGAIATTLATIATAVGTGTFGFANGLPKTDANSLVQANVVQVGGTPQSGGVDVAAIQGLVAVGYPPAVTLTNGSLSTTLPLSGMQNGRALWGAYGGASTGLYWNTSTSKWTIGDGSLTYGGSKADSGGATGMLGTYTGEGPPNTVTGYWPSTTALNLPTFPANFGTMVIDSVGGVNATKIGGTPAAIRPTIRTSTLSGIHNAGASATLAQDDAAVINPAIAALAASGGGIVLWDGFHGCYAAIKTFGGIEIKAVDKQTRLWRFGDAAGGTAGDVIVNGNPRVAVPSRGAGTTILGNPVSFPLTLSANVVASGAGSTSMSTQPYQGELLCPPGIGVDGTGLPNESWTAVPGGGLLMLLSDMTPDSGLPGEVVLITAATTNATTHVTTYTITRGAMGTTTVAHAETTTLLTEVILDNDIRITDLTIDMQAWTYSGYVSAAIYTTNTSTEYLCCGITMLGVDNLTINGVTVLNQAGFAIIIANTTGLVDIDGINVKSTASNMTDADDAVHLWGPHERIRVSNSMLSGTDCPMAINCGENDENGWGTLGAFSVKNMAYLSAGDLGTLDIEDCTIAGARGPVIGFYGGPNEIFSSIAFRRCLINNSANSLIVEDYYNTVNIESLLLQDIIIELVADGGDPFGGIEQYINSIENMRVENLSYHVISGSSLNSLINTPVSAGNVHIVGLHAPVGVIPTVAITDCGGSVRNLICDGIDAPGSPMLNLTGSTGSLIYQNCNVMSTFAATSSLPTAVRANDAPTAIGQAGLAPQANAQIGPQQLTFLGIDGNPTYNCKFTFAETYLLYPAWVSPTAGYIGFVIYWDMEHSRYTLQEGIVIPSPTPDSGTPYSTDGINWTDSYNHHYTCNPSASVGFAPSTTSCIVVGLASGSRGQGKWFPGAANVGTFRFSVSVSNPTLTPFTPFAITPVAGDSFGVMDLATQDMVKPVYDATILASGVVSTGTNAGTSLTVAITSGTLQSGYSMVLTSAATGATATATVSSLNGGTGQPSTAPTLTLAAAPVGYTVQAGDSWVAVEAAGGGGGGGGLTTAEHTMLQNLAMRFVGAGGTVVLDTSADTLTVHNADGSVAFTMPFSTTSTRQTFQPAQ